VAALMRVIIAGGGIRGLATALADFTSPPLTSLPARSDASPLARSTAEMLCYRRHYGAAAAREPQ